jgi:hypothetical protein
MPHNVQYKSTGTGVTLAILILGNAITSNYSWWDIINIHTVHLWLKIMHIMDIIYIHTAV